MSRFHIAALRTSGEGSDELAARLPLTGSTLDMRGDQFGGGPWFYAVLDDPIATHPAPESAMVWLTDVVFRPYNEGEMPSFGMRSFPVELGLVLDAGMRDEQIVDLDRVQMVAVVEIDDADESPPETESDGRQQRDSAAAGAPEGAAPLPVPDFPAPAPTVAAAAPAAAPPVAPEAVEALPPPAPDPAPDRDDELPQPLSGPPLAAAPPQDIFPAAPPPVRSAEVSERRPRPAAPRLPARPSAAPTPPTPERDVASNQVTGAMESVGVETARSRRPLMMAAAAASVLILGGIGLWSVQRGSTPPETAATGVSQTAAAAPASTTTTAPPTPSPESIAKVKTLLPPGYARSSCRPAAETEPGGLATLSCDTNTDPGGPPVAEYTLFPNNAALSAAFDRLVATSSQIICPGNIQSPGPWRRNRSPEKEAGILFCGNRSDRPTIIWSDQERLLLSVVQSNSGGPTLEQLYEWWSQHS